MPLGWERINSKKSTPNKNIVFIKPRPGPDQSMSQDYLERIAAQCVPIMNKNFLSVVSLEEYEPNFEFWGRNFNHGEVIQLVLKSPTTGRWLPFKFVQMVMMHELAHCKQMNHSKAFWAVRNSYSNHVKELWAIGYTGEGLWGKGVLLKNEMISHENIEEGDIMPENLCGGTFRPKSYKKRKAKPTITYQERKERRILNKFGTNGKALGSDENMKSKLEKKSYHVQRPRVAASLRGRELRAAAALERAETLKQVPDIKAVEVVDPIDIESGSESENHSRLELNGGTDAENLQLLDKKCRDMVRVCEKEDQDNPDSKDEIQELLKLSSCNINKLPSRTTSEPAIQNTPKLEKSADQLKNKVRNTAFEIKSVKIESNESKQGTQEDQVNHLMCPVCSFSGDENSLTCAVCLHVLKPASMPNSWRCCDPRCSNKLYINSGDVAYCGICSGRRSSSPNI